MRFLFLEWSLSSRMGGMELCMFEQCVQLSALGHNVTIGYHDAGDLLPQYVAAGVRPIHMAHYAPLRRTLPKDTLGLTGNLLRTLPRRFDVVAANSYQSTFFGAVLARAKRIPLVCHLRLNPPGGATAPTRLGMRDVTRFIAESESVRDLWVQRGLDPSAFDVVHDGIDTMRFRPIARAGTQRSALGLSEDDFVLFTGGRIDPVKDLEGLLDAFALVRAREPRARLLIAGTPVNHGSSTAGENYLASLKTRAAALGIADDVRWLGHRSDMPELYSAADAVVLFGKIPEPFGRVTCEALACGRPMVTPRQGGSMEILTGEFARLMFKPGATESAAGVLLSLVDWQQKDPGFAQRARDHIRERFDLASMGERLDRTFRAIVARGVDRRGPGLGVLAAPPPAQSLGAV